jgi:hypothetical protein
VVQDALEDQAFGVLEHFNQTNLHPLAGVALGVLGLLALFLPRRFSLIPVLALVCLVPSAQRLTVLGLDFTILRIMVLIGGFRILVRGEVGEIRWQAPDTVMVLWCFAYSAAYILLWGTFGSAIWVSGKMFEGLGLYFIIRCLLRSWDDLRIFSLALVALSVVVSIALVYESLMARNLFSIFGGVPETPAIREGRLRCQGAFPHPILAGCFWVALMPYMIALWWRRYRFYRSAAAIGAACSIIIIITCASSTPIISLMAGIGAGAWFLLRHYTALLRYAVLGGLVVLHLFMKSPVWFLLARIDVSGGSTGYHRSLLIDRAISNFSEWALIGTKSTEHWDDYGALKDVTNEFVLTGVRGGFLGLALFVLIIWMCFGRVGRLWRSAGSDYVKSVAAWALGVSLLCHVTSFMAVSYYGQVIFGWYFSLAVIVSLSEPGKTGGHGRRRDPETRTQPPPP